MINLIPNEEKKKKVKDFYYRLSIIFFEMVAFSLFVASVAILPSYFVSLVKKNFINTMLENQKNEILPPSYQKTRTVLNDFKNQLKLVENNQQESFLLSDKIIREILLKKIPEIKITEIIYDSTTNLGKVITVKGMATSRERLLLFRQALEMDVNFKKVDLPISNFIKGSNIQFSFNLIPS